MGNKLLGHGNRFYTRGNKFLTFGSNSTVNGYDETIAFSNGGLQTVSSSLYNSNQILVSSSELTPNFSISSPTTDNSNWVSGNLTNAKAFVQIIQLYPLDSYTGGFQVRADFSSSVAAITALVTTAFLAAQGFPQPQFFDQSYSFQTGVQIFLRVSSTSTITIALLEALTLNIPSGTSSFNWSSDTTGSYVNYANSTSGSSEFVYFTPANGPNIITARWKGSTRSTYVNGIETVEPANFNTVFSNYRVQFTFLRRSFTLNDISTLTEPSTKITRVTVEHA